MSIRSERSSDPTAPPSSADRLASVLRCGLRLRGEWEDDVEPTGPPATMPGLRGVVKRNPAPRRANNPNTLPPIVQTPGATVHDGTVDYQAFLKTEGYVVVPTPLTDPDLRAQTQAGFLQHIRESPEFRNPAPGDPTWKPSLGGFAAMANPSSFHHEWVRRTREQLTAAVLETDAIPIEGRKLEKVFDRLLYRIAGETPTAESMHRDEAETALDGDVVFGGWANFEDVPQYLLCAPRTHTEVGNQNKGFAKIEKTEYPRYKPLMRRVEIPPGCVLIFYERLVHEVVATSADRTMIRMFLGFRVTDATEPLFGTATTMRWIQDQAVPKIKSGQDPPVWPSAYSNFPRNFQTLEDWSRRTYVDRCLYTYTVGGSGAATGTQRIQVRAKMLSLREYGLTMHTPYSTDEVQLLFPRREWKLRTFDSPHTRVPFSSPDADEWGAFQYAQHTVPIGMVVSRPAPERGFVDGEVGEVSGA